jgi:hypothetical protein
MTLALVSKRNINPNSYRVRTRAAVFPFQVSNYVRVSFSSLIRIGHLKEACA